MKNIGVTYNNMNENKTELLEETFEMLRSEMQKIVGSSRTQESVEVSFVNLFPYLEKLNKDLKIKTLPIESSNNEDLLDLCVRFNNIKAVFANYYKINNLTVSGNETIILQSIVEKYNKLKVVEGELLQRLGETYLESELLSIVSTPEGCPEVYQDYSDFKREFMELSKSILVINEDLNRYLVFFDDKIAKNMLVKLDIMSQKHSTILKYLQ